MTIFATIVLLKKMPLIDSAARRAAGWVYVYQQKDSDHYDVISKIKTRPGSGTSLFVPQFNRFYVASQALDDQAAAIFVFEPVP